MNTISIQQWRASGDYFSYRERHRIFHCIGGDVLAPPLLLIHGFPTASWDWQALWQDLCRNFYVIAPDLIGFGLSDKPRRYDYSIFDQADLCQALLNRLGVAHCHVLAHDYGDTVAQELLARHLENRARLDSICFLNGGLFPETHRPVLIQRLLKSPIGGLVARLTSKRRFADNLRRIFGEDTPPDDEHIDTFWDLLRAQDGLLAMARLIGYMDERRAHRARWVGALERSAVPMKLVVGAADPISGEHMTQRYRELIAAPDISLLPRIGHYPQVEAPEAVLAAYRAFVGR